MERFERNEQQALLPLASCPYRRLGAPKLPEPARRPGKTHLAISLAVAAAESGRRVYYGTLAGLIESLMDAKAAGELSRRLRVLTHPALLVVDEIGYLPVTQDGAALFFQLINLMRSAFDQRRQGVGL